MSLLHIENCLLNKTRPLGLKSGIFATLTNFLIIQKYPQNFTRGKLQYVSLTAMNWRS